MNKSLSDLRRDYNKFKLDENSIKKNPFEQFKIWFDEALAGNFEDPNAMVLSTATKEGKPSSRVVLLKNYNEQGFVFFTNYESRKAAEIDENPQAALLFFWDKFDRQVRIEGRLEKTTEEESYEYFKTRPLTSRLGAWASLQSKPLKSRFTLMREVVKLALKYRNEVPLPPYWGGYRLKPDEFEYWQGRESRLHDRFCYKPTNGEWVITRLYP